jgi:periplasmic mercuric ion binding protein
MNTFNKPRLARASQLLCAAGALMLAFSAQANTLKLQVNGMVCAFCAQGIEKRLTAMPAVGPVYINLERKVVALAPKAGQSLDIERVKKEIVEAGYDVNKVETVQQTVAQIRAEARAKK